MIFIYDRKSIKRHFRVNDSTFQMWVEQAHRPAKQYFFLREHIQEMIKGTKYEEINIDDAPAVCRVEDITVSPLDRLKDITIPHYDAEEHAQHKQDEYIFQASREIHNFLLPIQDQFLAHRTIEERYQHRLEECIFNLIRASHPSAKNLFIHQYAALNEEFIQGSDNIRQIILDLIKRDPFKPAKKK